MTTSPTPHSILPFSRLPLTFPVWSSIIAAHLIATGGQPRWLILALQLGAGAAVLWSTMVLQATFELKSDHQDRQAPLANWVVGAGLMALGLGLATLAGGGNQGAAVALGAALLGHGLFRDGTLGPLLMGASRYLLWMLGFAAVPLLAGAQFLVMPVFLYAAGVAFLAGGGEKGRPAYRLGLILLVVATLLIIGAIVAGRLDILTLAPLGLGTALVAYGVWRLGQDPAPEAVRNLADQLLLGLIPLDALLLFGTGHWMAAAGLLLLIIPMWLLPRGAAAG